MFKKLSILFDKLIFRYRQYKQNKATKIYLVVCYAKWCVREYSYAGKMRFIDRYQMKCPLVYYYDDHNGTYEEWKIINIFNTTTGWIDSFTFDKSIADSRVVALNAKLEGGV